MNISQEMTLAKPMTASQWGTMLDASTHMKAALELLSLATSIAAVRAQAGQIPPATALRMLNVHLASETASEAQACFDSLLLDMAITEISQHPDAQSIVGSKTVAIALQRANQFLRSETLARLGEQQFVTLELRSDAGDPACPYAEERVLARDTTATSAIPAALARACHGVLEGDMLALQALGKRLDAAREMLCQPYAAMLSDRLPSEVEHMRAIAFRAHCPLTVTSVFVALADKAATATQTLRPILSGYSMEDDPRISPFAAADTCKTVVSPGIKLRDSRSPVELIEEGTAHLVAARAALEGLLQSAAASSPASLMWCASQLSQAQHHLDQPAYRDRQVA